MILKSDRLTHVHSDIRGPLYVEALRMQAAGTPVLRLNTGNPGNFGFQMPQSVRQALLENVDKAVPYCDVRGMAAARQAILEYHKSCGIQDITPEDIYICNGVSEAVSMLMSALVGTGGSLNYGGWADPQTEQLLAACAAAEDRAAALSDLCAYLQQQAPILPLCFKSSSVLYQTGAVSGLTPTAAEPFYDLPSCQIHLRQP